MKCSFLIALFSSFNSGVDGFPGYPSHVAAGLGSLASQDLDNIHYRAREKRLSNPSTTAIEVTGEHQFIPPDFDNGAQRGPCPGLNALANHGYISRTGVTSLTEVAGAINQVFGMGLDLATILSVMGTVFVGNPLSLNPGFSIGGPASGAQNILGNVFGLLGTPRGLNGSHNIIEGDSSNTRGDLYVMGDASTMVLEQFRSFYDMSTEDGDYNFDLFTDRAAIRFHESLSSNPNFYYGPFTGMIARNAGYLFACRMFANYSVENPGGTLSG